ncbi:guided entry of tail-anchored proteins factor 1 isoform X2 [Oryctolagus cuniculus]|uniref:guided entry of tail-anchored proteins factor 1 isoform X2 n=1 Tax=Oryctolagus cuniculus TaxID=9986 RepID=UPI00387A5815
MLRVVPADELRGFPSGPALGVPGAGAGLGLAGPREPRVGGRCRRRLRARRLRGGVAGVSPGRLEAGSPARCCVSFPRTSCGVFPQLSRALQKDAEQESQMRAEIQDMKQELSTVNMMDEFARESTDSSISQDKMGYKCCFLRFASGPDDLAHLEVLLCACGCCAQEVDHPARPPGGFPFQSRRWCWNHLLDFGL